MKDLDAAFQEICEEYCTRLHEHVELTVRSVEYPRCAVTRTFHPRDCRCEPDQAEPSKPISDAWLGLFGREEAV